MIFPFPVTLSFFNILSLLEVFNVGDKIKIVKRTLRMSLRK
jgi:hypothetical protein